MKALSRPVRQIAAITLLLILLLVIWSLLVQPILALSTDRKAEIATLSDQLVQLRAIVERRPVLQERTRAASKSLAARALFWSGPSHTAIASRIQDLIRNAASSGGGQVVSFSEGGTSREEGFVKLSVRFRLEGSLDALQRVLATIETTHPALFVDNLAVSAMESSSSPTHPPQLGAEIGLAGYLQDDGA